MLEAGIQAKIVGKVQGVWFRASTQQKAQQLGLSGWVKNTADGGVLCQAFGPQDALVQFTDWLHEGPPAAKVSQVNITSIAHETHQDFVINRD